MSKSHAHREQSKAYYIYGKHAVLMALQNEGRDHLELLVTAEMAQTLKAEGASLPISPHVMERKALDQLLPREAVHQGIILKTNPLPNPDFTQLLKSFDEDPGFIVILDQVTDPHNIGAVLRSAAAFGARAVVVQDRHSPPETGVLAKAASGALEVVPYCRVTNIARTIDLVKKAGYWTVGLAGEAEQSLTDTINNPDRYALILGAEGDGMRLLTRENCDFLVKLPTDEPISSLNVSNAAAVSFFYLSNLLK